MCAGAPSGRLVQVRAPRESGPATGGDRRVGEPVIWPAVLAGLVAAVLVHVLLAPTSGVDTDPPVCWSYPGYVVPCDSSLWIGVAVIAGLIVGAAVYAALRWKRS